MRMKRSTPRPASTWISRPSRRQRRASGTSSSKVRILPPNVAHFVIRLSLLIGRFDYIDRGILDHTHLRFFTERSVRALVANAGLRVELFTATPAPLYQVLPRRFHKRWLAATHAINAWIAHRLPRLMGYQFVILARPKEIV